jgi:hypothetical protein
VRVVDHDRQTFLHEIYTQLPSVIASDSHLCPTSGASDGPPHVEPLGAALIESVITHGSRIAERGAKRLSPSFRIYKHKSACAFIVNFDYIAGNVIKPFMCDE